MTTPTTASHSDPRAATSGAPLVIVGALFCISGMSALIYQVAWQRILVLHSGVGIYSVSIIVAAFLAGLGLGNYAGGVLSARVPPPRALRIFAVVELLIGLFAFASCFLYYNVLYLGLPGLYENLWQASVLHFLALLLPTTLMGMSLPFLVKAMVHDARTASRTIGYLYGINVLGAAAGALLAPWVLMRLFGIQGAVIVGGCGNLLAGAAALIVGALRPPRGSAGPAEPAGDEPPLTEPAGSRPFGLWITLYTLSGFCALSLEILWFRLIDVAVKSTAFTFGTVLAIYLLGLGVGSLVGGPLAVGLRRPLRAFLSIQGLLMSYSGLAVLLLVALPASWPFYGGFVEYWGQYEEFGLGRVWDWGQIARLYLLLPLFLYGPPTFLMGLSFGVLQRAVQDDLQTTGRKVGILQSGNIVGNVAGSLITGLLLLHVLGTAGALWVLLLFGLVFIGLGIRYYGLRWDFAVLGSVLLLLLVVRPGNDALWRRLHGQVDRGALIEEDATSVAAITTGPSYLQFSLNGKGQSWLPFGGIHSQLGSVPALIHPAPRDVAVIGLGSGDTAWAAGCRRETERITVFELGSPQRRLLARLVQQTPLRDLQAFLDDPRVTVLTTDGRNALAWQDARYDIIEADALRPQSAYAGNIYSLEFFRLCAGKLKPGGLMCTWSPTPRVYRTFCEAFPHVLDFANGVILVGSNEPLSADKLASLRRLESPDVLEYLGASIAAESARALTSVRPAMPERYAHMQPNRDMFPRDELVSPDAPPFGR